MPDIYVAPSDKNITPPKDPSSSGLEKHPHFHSKNPFAAFSKYPDGVRFETQEEKEEIILLLRKHIITNLFWVLGGVLLIFGGPLLLTGIKMIIPFSLPGGYQFIIILIYYSLTFSFIILNFLSWYYNIYIVTNERIVDVDFYNLTYKQISSAPLSKIQDVTIKSGGVIRTIFNFADVFIQTAGAEVNFDFVAVPKPDQVARQILELTEKSNNPI